MATKKKAKPAAAPEVTQVIEAFKGFDMNMQCRGFQFELGKTYTHDGDVKACASGFHACENPLDVFGYYPPGTSRFAVVELSGALSREANGDSKVAAASITIKAELSIPTIVQRAIEWVTAHCAADGSEHSTGDRSAASATGDRSAASATGDRSAASATGYWSAASATGYQSAASATGYQSAASATGYQSAASATGYQSAASATGDRSAASATGDRSAASATGKHGVALAAGIEGRAMATETNGIVLCYRNENGELIHIRASKVGDNGIRAGVWYSLNEHCEFVEAA